MFVYIRPIGGTISDSYHHINIAHSLYHFVYYHGKANEQLARFRSWKLDPAEKKGSEEPAPASNP